MAKPKKSTRSGKSTPNKANKNKITNAKNKKIRKFREYGFTKGDIAYLFEDQSRQEKSAKQFAKFLQREA